jgi:hypothetical protein
MSSDLIRDLGTVFIAHTNFVFLCLHYKNMLLDDFYFTKFTFSELLALNEVTMLKITLPKVGSIMVRL